MENLEVDLTGRTTSTVVDSAPLHEDQPISKNNNNNKTSTTAPATKTMTNHPISKPGNIPHVTRDVDYMGQIDDDEIKDVILLLQRRSGKYKQAMKAAEQREKGKKKQGSNQDQGGNQESPVKLISLPTRTPSIPSSSASTSANSLIAKDNDNNDSKSDHPLQSRANRFKKFLALDFLCDSMCGCSQLPTPPPPVSDQSSNNKLGNDVAANHHEHHHHHLQQQQQQTALSLETKKSFKVIQKRAADVVQRSESVMSEITSPPSLLRDENHAKNNNNNNNKAVVADDLATDPATLSLQDSEHNDDGDDDDHETMGTNDDDNTLDTSPKNKGRVGRYLDYVYKQAVRFELISDDDETNTQLTSTSLLSRRRQRLVGKIAATMSGEEESHDETTTQCSTTSSSYYAASRTNTSSSSTTSSASTFSQYLESDRSTVGDVDHDGSSLATSQSPSVMEPYITLRPSTMKIRNGKKSMALEKDTVFAEVFEGLEKEEDHNVQHDESVTIMKENHGNRDRRRHHHHHRGGGRRDGDRRGRGPSRVGRKITTPSLGAANSTMETQYWFIPRLR